MRDGHPRGLPVPLRMLMSFIKRGILCEYTVQKGSFFFFCNLFVKQTQLENCNFFTAVFIRGFLYIVFYKGLKE